jgi:hypothetical protein
MLCVASSCNARLSLDAQRSQAPSHAALGDTAWSGRTHTRNLVTPTFSECEGDEQWTAV